jgi:hypothetical protein
MATGQKVVDSFAVLISTAPTERLGWGDSIELEVLALTASKTGAMLYREHSTLLRRVGIGNV